MRLLPVKHEVLKKKLTDYIANDPLYALAYEYTKQRFKAATHLTAHNWAHAYRDTLNAIVIGEAEGADMSIVLPAATMHDIGFLYGATGATHGEMGANKLLDYLKEGGIAYPPDKAQAIAECIRTHKGSWHAMTPVSVEAKVVADADLLEKFGPFGIYQTIRTYGEFDYPLEKILGRKAGILKVALETATGQMLAEPGRQFILDFYHELEEAAEPYGNEY